MADVAIADTGTQLDSCRRAGSPVLKRSIVLRGHKTSVSLEGPFWTEIKRMAREHGASLSSFVAEIDDRRGSGGLSTAIRIAVVQDLRKAAQAIDNFESSPNVYPEEQEAEGVE